jgi:hypothetical protein
MDWVDQTPLWIVGLSCMAGLIVAHEFGYRTGRRFVPKDGHTDAKGYLVSSALSLASLMMAFTFGAAQTDFRLRQGLVSAEANAIGTAYLRIQTLDQPARDQLSARVLRYARVRGGFYGATGDQAALSVNDARTRELQARIWTEVGDAARTNPMPTLNGPLLQSVNEMFDSADSRAAAQDIRVPPAVLLMLVIAGVVSAALVGFAGSGGRRYSVILVAVLFIQVLAFCLILALDRPDATTVKINQRPLDRAIAEIGRGEALKGSALDR